MSKIPVLAIGSFVDSKKPAYFYASRLSVHLAEKHALISHPHKHDFYLTVFFSAGRGMHEVDFSRYKVEPGSVLKAKAAVPRFQGLINPLIFWNFTK